MSVCGTGRVYLEHRRFSWKSVYGHYQRNRSLAVLSPSTFRADLPTQNISTGFNVVFRHHANLSLLRLSIAVYTSTGILTSCPSTTPPLRRVCLRSRLTLIRRTLIRKPESIGVKDSHLYYRYLFLHLLFQALQQG